MKDYKMFVLSHSLIKFPLDFTGLRSYIMNDFAKLIHNKMLKICNFRKNERTLFS